MNATLMSSPASKQRSRFLKLGLGATAWCWRWPAARHCPADASPVCIDDNKKLGEPARQLMRAVAVALFNAAICCRKRPSGP